ncbi:hypothetical protein [Roseovarius nanhaiticus]|uniref:Uncharacterized protein n=1 Tax=Roseovarius nanhaiticus TaxID=573024 RepID=A0A1N7FPR2_9RHOB|nr:hypothetical protein [Roseovarius nanhaiticus]SEK48885.1 hypothetical protein SAMN05216208_0886 [Roseovarius nanhaiticus]SIS02301.1 hypothetical protein SAMN05421666_1250 [Roseovarius nanhaiticus]
MTALPDTFMPEGPLRHQRVVPQHHIEMSDDGGLRRLGMRGTALSLLVASVGLWLVPVIEGDAMMQLFKLAFSAAMAMIGVMLLGARVGPMGPEVRVDPATRRMTIIERGHDGHVRSETVHDIDALGDIVLRDGLLTARCAGGQTLVTLPVSDPRIEAALMRVLANRAA